MMNLRQRCEKLLCDIVDIPDWETRRPLARAEDVIGLLEAFARETQEQTTTLWNEKCYRTGYRTGRNGVLEQMALLLEAHPAHRLTAEGVRELKVREEAGETGAEPGDEGGLRSEAVDLRITIKDQAETIIAQRAIYQILASKVKAFEDTLSDQRRLVRELDAAISGEAGVAEQASLCDLIGPARSLREQNDQLRQVAEAARLWTTARNIEERWDFRRRTIEALQRARLNNASNKGADK